MILPFFTHEFCYRANKTARLKGKKVSPWVRVLRRITRWSSQFTRWIQDAIVHSWEWDAGLAKLRPLMRAYLC